MSTGTPIGRGVTVTIKYGRGYESPWAVFHGQPHEIREDIAAFFGMAPQTVSALTLSDIVVNATIQAHGVATVASGLDATVVESHTNQPSAGPSSQPAPAAPAGPDPWAQASTTQTSAPEPAGNPILDRIARATDVPSLQRIWAADPSAFSDPAVMAAWKARGRELTPR